MIDVIADRDLPGPAELGMSKLMEALAQGGWDARRLACADRAGGNPILVAGLSSDRGGAAELARRLGAVSPAAPESLAIRRTTSRGVPAVAAAGADARGLMYALLDLAQRVTWAERAGDPFAHVRSTTESPFASERTMSIYTMHRGVWETRLHDRGHWLRTFELMAASRLNGFVVIFGYENGGFMAPAYPYFFDVPGFPGVRLVGLTAAEQARNAEAFRIMIDTAHGCGIQVTAGLWDHIYRGRVQDGGIPGAPQPGEERPGVVVGLTGENVGAYNHAALGLFLDLFPGIDGLQLRMHGESGLTSGEMGGFWRGAFRIIGEKRPHMRIDLRAKELPDAFIDDALSVGLDARVSTKYWMEQMGLPYHPTHVNVQDQQGRRHGYADLLRNPPRFRMQWQLWNAVTGGGLLWADPAWMRRFVPTTRMRGDGFEFSQPNATWMLGLPHDLRPLPVHNAPYRAFRYEIERHWHTLQLFGRLGYDPEAPSEIWEREFARRFGAAGPSLMAALHEASAVPPRIVAAASCYTMFATTVGSVCRDSQGSLPEFALAEGSDIQQFVSFREEADLILGGGETARRRPGATTSWFASAADRILAAASAAERAGGPTPEGTVILADARMLAHLARFYARRIPAAVSYNLFARTGDLFALDDAAASERDAVAAWRLLEEAAGDVYPDDVPIGIRRPSLHGHWRDERVRLEATLADLERVRTESDSRFRGGTSSIAHVPVRRLAPGEDLVIRVSVLWPYETSRVGVSVLAADRGTRTWPLRHAGGARYQGVVAASELPERFAYAVDAQSRDGHRIATPGGLEDPIRVLVSGDNEPPRIRHAAVRSAKAGKAFRVRARATDPSGVAWVRLRYRHLCQCEDYRSIGMTRSGDRYEAAIPPSFVTAEWDLMYFIEAMDSAGNGVIHPDLDLETPYIVVAVRP